MPVFVYTAVSSKNEGHVENGRIVARDRLDAYDKLRRLDYTDIQLKRMEGMSAFLAQLTADIR